MENSPRSQYEVEQTREKLPVKDMEVASVELTGTYDDNLPEGKFSSHEDMIVYKGQSGASRLMPRIEASVDQLKSQGFEDAGSDHAVPYTGAQSEQRNSQEFQNARREMVYNLASKDNGIGSIDHLSLDEEQMKDLDSVGYHGSTPNHPYLLKEGSASFRVSEGRNAEDIEYRAEMSGTFSEVPIVVDAQGREISGIAFTDHRGNQDIAPKTESLQALLTDLGYRQAEAPGFNTDISAIAESTRNQWGEVDVNTEMRIGQFLGGNNIRKNVVEKFGEINT